MEGRGNAPVPTGSTTAPHRQVSNRASSALAAVSIVLILLYVLWRFFWLAKKHGDSSGAAAASPSSSSSSAPSRVAASCLGAGEAVARRALPVFVRVEAATIGSGSASEKADCAVCLGELGVGEAAARLVPGCGHGFHAECIEAWFRVSSTCPLCRATVAAAGHATA